MTKQTQHDNRVVIVTGASAGIGKEIATQLAEEGHSVVLAARSEAKLSAITDELRGRGLTAESVSTDVSDPSSLDALVKQTLRRFGRIDVLINNAGVDLFAPSESISVLDIQETVQVNLIGSMILSRLVLPSMLQQGSGHIINISSTSGLFGAAFGGVYAATKAGQIAFTRSLRSEYSSRGVMASVICPGFADEGGIYESMKARIGRGTPSAMGSTSTKRIASAVLKTMRSAAPETIVNWPPYRPLVALQGIAPRLAGWITKKVSFRFLKRVATAEPKQSPRRRAA